ncbi:hypothetical protein [Cupriavidus metallidurans]
MSNATNALVCVPRDRLQQVERDLDACQKVIHYAGGFDPAYVKDAQARLTEIRAWLATAPTPAQVNPAPESDMALTLRTGFKTSEVIDGRYQLRIQFPTMEAMNHAEDELHALMMLAAPGEALAVCAALLERTTQNIQWGGQEHDDQHSSADWVHFIQKQTIAAMNEGYMHVMVNYNLPAVQDRMRKIAALALAAWGSLNRRITREAKEPGYVD